MEQRERGERHPPVTLPVTRLAHRQIVRERYEPYPRRPDTVLHGERDGGDAALFYGVADQPDGPVAQGSGGREQDDVHPILCELARHLRGGAPGEQASVVYGAHKGEVTAV